MWHPWRNEDEIFRATLNAIVADRIIDITCQDADQSVFAQLMESFLRPLRDEIAYVAIVTPIFDDNSLALNTVANELHPGWHVAKMHLLPRYDEALGDVML